MFIHERNNMSKIFNTLCLLAALLVSITTKNSKAADLQQFPMFTAACNWLKIGNNTKIAASSFLIIFLIDRYYKNKARPKDEDISAEGYARRKHEIAHGNHSLYEKIKLIISFIDDFYIFGRTDKSVEQETTTFTEDGTQIVVKEKKTVIKGTGPMTFIYKKIFGGLEDTLKGIKNIILLAAIVDGLLGAQINPLLNPMDGKFVIPVK